MKSQYHASHIKTRVHHVQCQECRADNERQFLRLQWPGYQFVIDYLAWAKPRLVAIKAGESSVNSRIWHDDFVKTMHVRISLKTGPQVGRKFCDSYLQRLGQFPRSGNGITASYLRRFARRGASTLN